ncbi:hypothetical protein ACFL5V_08360 [Fibrobacterota bacterium]
MNPSRVNITLTPDTDRNKAIQAVTSNYQQFYLVLEGRKSAGFLTPYDIWGMGSDSPVKEYLSPGSVLSPHSTGIDALKHLLSVKRNMVLVGTQDGIEGCITLWKLLGKGLRQT